MSNVKHPCVRPWFRLDERRRVIESSFFGGIQDDIELRPSLAGPLADSAACPICGCHHGAPGAELPVGLVYDRALSDEEIAANEACIRACFEGR